MDRVRKLFRRLSFALPLVPPFGLSALFAGKLRAAGIAVPGPA
ncbi:hypothetical protein ACFYV7_30080 [Nocardia suismassiliense]|uniref:Uncharacterized protein n=1 Tax=Nocardia suismassiliense TaxID=2077092 RepID=A0ABW6R0M4_9NOCA